MSNELKISYRDEEGFSDRSLLCNVSEADVADYIEREYLSNYKQMVNQIVYKQAELSEIRKELIELCENEEKKDSVESKNLQAFAIRIVKSIETLDREIREYEQAAPLQRVLEREKQKAFQGVEAKKQEHSSKEPDKTSKPLNYVLFQMFLRSLSLLCPLIVFEAPIWLICISTLFAFLPTIFKTPVPIFVSYHAYSIVRPILYVCGLIVAVQGRQDFLAIAFYILFGIQAWNIIKNLIGTVLIIITAIKGRMR